MQRNLKCHQLTESGAALHRLICFIKNWSYWWNNEHYVKAWGYHVSVLMPIYFRIVWISTDLLPSNETWSNYCKPAEFLCKIFCLTVFTFQVTLAPLSFCILRYLKFSLIQHFKQLMSIGGGSLLKVKWNAPQLGSFFLFFSIFLVFIEVYNVLPRPHLTPPEWIYQLSTSPIPNFLDNFPRAQSWV